jgi:hypothetical protein
MATQQPGLRGDEMIRACVLIVFAVVTLTGCVSTVSDSMGESMINGMTMSCSKPYPLTQDCSIWSGATRRILVEDYKVKVAATEDGDVVLVMDGSPGMSALKDQLLPFSLGKHGSTASNNSYTALRNFFDSAGVAVTRVRPVGSMGSIMGYVLELKSDGYSLLTDLTVKR